jgi:hypothetical protein
VERTISSYCPEVLRARVVLHYGQLQLPLSVRCDLFLARAQSLPSEPLALVSTRDHQETKSGRVILRIGNQQGCRAAQLVPIATSDRQAVAVHPA